MTNEEFEIVKNLYEATKKLDKVVFECELLDGKDYDKINDALADFEEYFNVYDGVDDAILMFKEYLNTTQTKQNVKESIKCMKYVHESSKNLTEMMQEAINENEDMYINWIGINEEISHIHTHLHWADEWIKYNVQRAEVIERLRNNGIEVVDQKKQPKNGQYSGLVGRKRDKIKFDF